MTLLNVTHNIKGNSQFEITAEVGEIFNTYFGDAFFPATDPGHKCYTDTKHLYPYPFKLDFLEIFNRLEDLNLLKKEDKYSKAPESIQAIVDQFKAFVFHKTQIWQNTKVESESESLAADCFFAYLITAYLSDSFVFLSEDLFGKNSITPIKLRRLHYQSGGFLQAASLRLSYYTYHYYSDEEYYRVETDISLPIPDTLNLQNTPFVRDLESAHSHLNQRYEKLKALVGNACQSFNAENPNKTPFNLTRFMGGLVPEMALNERYLFNPQVTETHFEVYDDLSYDNSLLKHEEDPIENWQYSRTVAAFSLNRLKGRLVNLDWLVETPYDKDRINTLILPEKSKKELLAMCSATKNKTSYADPFRGKNAKIVLLEGVPGTGKTSSIMGISDFLEMPLIHLSIAALGDSGSVSYSLSRILQLAESFGAFVLIDEADILLKKRNIDNLQHNNIVTSVLKELESFNGLLFLTSNLAFEHVDEAVHSRLKRRVCFEYPAKDVLLKVWKLNLGNIGLQLSTEELEEIAQLSFELRLDLRKVVNICSLLHDLRSYDPEMEIDVLSYVTEA